MLLEQVLHLVFGYIFLTGIKSIKFACRHCNIRPWILFLLFWAITFFVWKGLPIARSYFVYQPTAPNHEYYPLFDAQRFDIAGQLMLSGQGIKQVGNLKIDDMVLVYLV